MGVWDIPAKILLSGEYSLLRGGPGIAVTLPLSPATRFRGSFAVEETAKDPGLWITTSLCNARPINIRDLDDHKPQHRFLKQALAFGRWDKVIAARPTARFEIGLQSGFAPSMGFGSSSATLLTLALASQEVARSSDAALRRQLFESLRAVQPNASGYDIAVQSEALHRASDRLAIWNVRPGDELPAVSEVDHAVLPESFLITTDVYDATCQSVSAFGMHSLAWAKFCDAQDGLTSELYDALRVPASKFQWQSWFERTHAAQQTLWRSIDTPLPDRMRALMQTLRDEKYFFKALGAGRGDCLWVLGKPAVAAPWTSSVVFQFSASEATQ